MGDNSFHTTVESLFKGMDSFITTKTVVGDAIHIGDTIILPLVDVSFGVAAGAFSQEKKNNGAGGMGGKITPSAVLVIQNGTTKLVNIKNQDGLTKVLDMVPDFVNKFTSKGEIGRIAFCYPSENHSSFFYVSNPRKNVAFLANLHSASFKFVPRYSFQKSQEVNQGLAALYAARTSAPRSACSFLKRAKRSISSL